MGGRTCRCVVANDSWRIGMPASVGHDSHSEGAGGARSGWEYRHLEKRKQQRSGAVAKVLREVFFAVGVVGGGDATPSRVGGPVRRVSGIRRIARSEKCIVINRMLNFLDWQLPTITMYNFLFYRTLNLQSLNTRHLID